MRARFERDSALAHSCISQWYPSTLLAHCRSIPSGVSCRRRGHSAALFMSTSMTRGSRLTRATTSARRPRSHDSTETLGCEFPNPLSARSARVRSRTTSTSSKPRPARPRAMAAPIAPLAPVTTASGLVSVTPASLVLGLCWSRGTWLFGVCEVFGEQTLQTLVRVGEGEPYLSPRFRIGVVLHREQLGD